MGSTPPPQNKEFFSWFANFPIFVFLRFLNSPFFPYVRILIFHFLNLKNSRGAQCPPLKILNLKFDYLEDNDSLPFYLSNINFTNLSLRFDKTWENFNGGTNRSPSYFQFFLFCDSLILSLGFEKVGEGTGSPLSTYL